MSDRLRSKIVSELAKEINHLSGGSFEQFGYKVMPLVQPGDWAERGTTVDGAPRKATVDTSLGGSAYVGEMSSKAGYFTGDLAKLKADLQHAFDVHPQVKHIWLLAARTANAGQTTAIDNAIAAFKNGHPSVDSVTVLDARQIAAHIFEHLGRRDLVRDLAHYLPGLTKAAEENAFSHGIPPIDAYRPRNSIEARIVDALKSAPYVILQGMSGIGKTALAARVAQGLASKFDNCIWLDARDVDGIEKLRCVSLSRSGVNHNVVSLVRNGRILLVIDDPAFALADLRNFQFGASKVIVTTQVATGPNVLPIGDLEPEEAQLVLTADVAATCPQHVLAKVVAEAGGHPLLLRALNQLAAVHGWAAVEACVATASLSELEDEKNENIFRRVLRRQTDLAYELQFVRWLGARQFAEELANAASSMLAEKLRKRGFLAATSVGHVRVHDLVYNAIQTEVVVEEKVKARVRQRIAAFIRTECDSDRSLLHRLARAHADFFARAAAEGHELEFVYMVAMNRTAAATIPLLGDPVAVLEHLLKLPSLQDRTLEIRAVIEVVEALYTLREGYATKEEARAKLARDIEALVMLLGAPGLSSAQSSMLQYHRAKMILRLDAKSEDAGKNQAISIFRELVEQLPSHAAARNQLAKVLPAEASIEQCEIVLRKHVEDPGSVNWNIVLDSFRLLVRHGANMTKHTDLLMATIDYAKSIDSSEAIRFVVAVAQRAWFGAPQLLLPMFEALGTMAEEGIPSDAFHLAQVHKFAAMEAGDDQRGALLARAVRLYEEAQGTMEYQLTHYAEALLLVGQPQHAKDVLAGAPPERRSAFWWQRQAEALSRTGDHPGGLAAIDRAIASIPDPSLLPDFYRSRYRIRQNAGSNDAQRDLEHALNLLPGDHPFRRKLDAERSQQ